MPLSAPLYFEVEDLPRWKEQVLACVRQEAVGVCLDSNESEGLAPQRYELLAAAGVKRRISINTEDQADPFQALEEWVNQRRSWAFGYFGYDLKNRIEPLSSGHPDELGFADLFFFEPEWVLSMEKGSKLAKIEGAGAAALLREILAARDTGIKPPSNPIALRPVMSHEQYIERLEKIRRLILEGDLYEMNLCRALEARDVSVDPAALFRELNQRSKAPFAAFLRIEDRYLLCASPERFLYKSAEQLVSQPIKGTRPRSADPSLDAALAEDLRLSEKDKAENVMIVDLVRNDLARVCQPGSVRVDELFGIYSFTSVHQMISTVSGRLKEGIHPVEAIRAAFPMGSMTGAPKVRAMQRIEELELSRRGLYSGALGYFTPDGDFDFNVVIRSLLYNADKQYLSCQVGGAIVYDSDPQSEWEETEWKLRGIREILR